MENTKPLRLTIAGAALAAILALGTGISSAGLVKSDSVPPPTMALTSDNAAVVEQVQPDGTCDLVDADGVPLYDSQFAERTGSAPCAEA